MYYASRCDLGDRKRNQNDRLPPGEQYVNEDSTAALVFDDIHRSTEREAGVFVVADGAGGEDAGDVASYLATSVISRELADYVIETLTEDPAGADVDIPEGVSPGGDRVDPETAIEEAVGAAQSRIVKYAKAAESEEADPNDPFRAYTTVVVGIYDGERLHYGWVGDTRAYVINTAAEQIAPLTKDHSEVQALEDAGAIDETEALVHPDSHKIRRAVGGTSFSDLEDSVEVDTDSVDLYADDVLLFTSDGLIDAYPDIDKLNRRYQVATDDEKASVAEEIRETVVTDDDIREIVLEGDSLDATAERFVKFSNEKGGKDNLSILLVHAEGLPSTPDPLPARGFEEREEKNVIEQETTIVPPEDSGSESNSGEAAGTEAEADPEAGTAADADEEVGTEGIATSDGDAAGGTSTIDRDPVDKSTSDTDEPEEETEDAESDAADSRGVGDDNKRGGASEESSGKDPTVRLVTSEDSYTVTKDETIGRGNAADVQIDGPNTISRVHVRVVRTNGAEWRLIDQDSTGGTFIQVSDEWKRVENTRTPPLESGTLIALGTLNEDSIFEFRL